MHNDASPENQPPEESPRMLRLLFEVPTDGLHDLVTLLTPLKHIAYRSDLWLTRDDSAPKSSDNGSLSDSPSLKSDEEKR